MQSLWGRDRRQANALQVPHNIKVFHFFNSFNRGILIISILECFERGKLRWKITACSQVDPRWNKEPPQQGRCEIPHRKGAAFSQGICWHLVILLFFCFVFASQGFHVFNSEKCQNQCWQPIKTNNKDDQSWQWFNSLSNLKKINDSPIWIQEIASACKKVSSDIRRREFQGSLAPSLLVVERQNDLSGTTSY